MLGVRAAVLPMVVVAATVLTVAPASAAESAGTQPSHGAGAPTVPGYVWTTTATAPGLAVYAGSLARPASHPTWTVTVFAPAIDVLTGKADTAELGTADWAHQTAQRLQTGGYQPTLAALPWPGYSDTPHGLEGYRVRTGSFPDKTRAAAATATLKAAGFPTATTQWTGYDGDQPVDAEQVHVAVIDPARWQGSITATHGATIAQRSTTSALAQQTHATVAVNGGYFVTADSDGFQGVPSGLAAYHGQLQAMAVGDRAALVLRNGHPAIEHLVSTVTVQAGGASQPVDGLNRRPGVVRDCGRAGLQPTTAPRQDLTCTATDDTVVFTAQFGAVLPTGPGTQAVLDAGGHVVSVGTRGGTIPAGGSAIQAIGAPATWITAHLHVGEAVATSSSVRDDRTGRTEPLDPAPAIVSAGPTLLANGQPEVDAVTEGFLDPHDLSFGFAFSEIRQPRTMVGIDAAGRLLLVTVDGRGPAISEGATLTELAELARQLGAREAMNLDGGGSTAMAVNGNLVTHPSDTTGERAIGDAVVIAP